MLNFFSGLGNLIFSIKKIAKIKTIINRNSLIRVLNNVLPKLGLLLYFSCILFELI